MSSTLFFATTTAPLNASSAPMEYADQTRTTVLALKRQPRGQRPHNFGKFFDTQPMYQFADGDTKQYYKKLHRDFTGRLIVIASIPDTIGTDEVIAITDVASVEGDMAAQSIDDIFMEVLGPPAPELDRRRAEERRKLQLAYIECRAHAYQGDDARLFAAFDLYSQEIMSRGDICSVFDLSVWEFTDARTRFLQAKDETQR